MEKAYFLTFKSKKDRILSSSVSRIYVWDAECDFNFVYYLKKDFYISDILNSWKKITIVSPCTCTQKTIDVFKQYLIDNLSIFHEHEIEIEINDFWIYYLLNELGIKVTFLIWPYLYYQKRDSVSYYLETHNDYSENDLDILWNISVNNVLYKRMFQEMWFKWLEIYNYTLLRDMNFVDLPIHLHYPHIVKSITKYCYNHLLSNNSQFLKVVEDCSWCEWKEWSYEYWNFWIVWKYSANKYYYTLFSQDLLKRFPISRIVYNFDF